MGRKNKIKQPFELIQYQESGEVTGSTFILKCDGKNILINYGAYQSSSVPIEKVYDLNRQKMKLPLDTIDYFCIVESHNDHIGNSGILSNPNVDYHGVGLTTEPCAEATRLILIDGAKIQQSECAKRNENNPDKKKLYPLFTKENVEDFMTTIRCYGYNEDIYLTDKLRLEFVGNGHLLGSSMAYFTYEDEDGFVDRFLLTSDFYKGELDRPFTKSIGDRVFKPKVLHLESTYAGRYHPKESPIEYLEKVIEEWVVDKNRILFIPTLAQARSSQLYYYLNEVMKKNKKIKDSNIPVYIVGELTNDLHKVYGKKEYDVYKDEKWQGHDELWNGMCGFKVLTQKGDVERFAMSGNHRRIILSSSGMLSGGWSVAIAEKFIKNKKVVFLPSSYIAEGTIGYEITRPDKPDVLINGFKRKNNMTVLPVIPNMSSHADTNGLVSFVKENINLHTLDTILISHGGEEERYTLKEILEKELPKKIKVKVFNKYDRIKF